jgi:hypothetical protein
MLLVVIALPLFAELKPVWTAQITSLSPRSERQRPLRETRFDFFDMQFAPGGQELIVSFVQYSAQKSLVSRDAGQNPTQLVARVWEVNTGNLIRTLEWPAYSGSPTKLRPLAGGGYIVLAQNRLQVLDDFLHPVRERKVEPERPGAALVSAHQGPYFLFMSSKLQPPLVQVIDSRSLSTVEQIRSSGPGDIEGDHFISVENGKVQEKKLGEGWQEMQTTLPGDTIRTAQFINEQAVAINGARCWATVRKDVVEGEPICYTDPNLIAKLQASSKSNRIAVLVCKKPTGVMRLLDVGGGACRVIVYDERVPRLVIPVPQHGYAHRFALSPDGQRVACMFENRLDVFTVP